MRMPAARQLALPLHGDARTAVALPETAAAPRPSADGARQRLLERAASLAERLADLLSERVRLTLTDNTSTMVSFRRARGGVAFRVHHMFAEAPADVVQALADYATRGKRGAGRVIDEFVRVNEERVRQARARKQARSLVPIGKIHDLRAMFEELNERCFDGTVRARIGWGREAPRRRRRSIKMGTYFHDAQVIRIHPALDRVEVPEFFVRFIVFHEMLHHVVTPVNVAGRRVSHTPEFRRRERAYADYPRALAWERKHLALLLGTRPRVRPFDPEDPLA